MHILGKISMSPDSCIFYTYKSATIINLRCLGFFFFFVISSNLLMFDYVFFSSKNSIVSWHLLCLSGTFPRSYLRGHLLEYGPQKVPWIKQTSHLLGRGFSGVIVHQILEIWARTPGEGMANGLVWDFGACTDVAEQKAQVTVSP